MAKVINYFHIFLSTSLISKCLMGGILGTIVFLIEMKLDIFQVVTETFGNDNDIRESVKQMREWRHRNGGFDEACVFLISDLFYC